MIDDRLSRRAFVGSATAGVTALGLLGPRAMWAAPAPTSPVVLARCETYDLGDLVKCLALAMDQARTIATARAAYGVDAGLAPSQDLLPGF